MKLYEYEAKNILKSYGIPTPRGEIALDPAEAQKAAAHMKPPFAVKAQVLVAGRGKAGGILFAENVEQVREVAEKLFRSQIRGIAVKKILVEERIPITKEIYLGVTVDRLERKYAVVTSSTGGVDIEETASETPKSIVKTPVDPRRGLTTTDAKQIVEKIGYLGSRQAELTTILVNLYRTGLDYDAELVEVNPVAETAEGRFVAVDARLIVDDNALFRHPELEKRLLSEEREKTPTELEAERAGLSYVKLDGNIGVVGNGAGLVMATVDMIQRYGGMPADFLDLGGGAPPERIAKALDIVTSDADVKVVLVNILGGMTHCDDVARAITPTKKLATEAKPFVVRLVGTNEGEGRRILEEAGIPVLDSMEAAAEHAAKIAGGTS